MIKKLLILFVLLINLRAEAMEYWLSQSSKKEETTRENIDLLNKQIINNKLCKVVDLSTYTKNVMYAIAINRTDLKIVPIKDTSSNYIQKVAQNKEILFGEPVVILEFLFNKKWAFVQTYNYRGYVKTKDLAITSRNSWLNYINKTNNFIILISRQLNIENIVLDMGVKLQLADETENYYFVKFPYKNINGFLDFKIVKLKKDDNFHKGYLKYTTHNIMQQAFKYLGSEYGWGGLNNNTDCSGLIVNVFSTFGFKFPRDSSEISNIKNSIAVNSANIEEKLNKAKAGSILYFKGHIMLYLGKAGNNYYIVHALGSDLTKNNKIIRNHEVLINDLNWHRQNGKTLLESITNIIEI